MSPQFNPDTFLSAVFQRQSTPPPLQLGKQPKYGTPWYWHDTTDFAHKTLRSKSDTLATWEDRADALAVWEDRAYALAVWEDRADALATWEDRAYALATWEDRADALETGFEMSLPKNETTATTFPVGLRNVSHTARVCLFFVYDHFDAACEGRKTSHDDFRLRLRMENATSHIYHT